MWTSGTPAGRRRAITSCGWLRRSISSCSGPSWRSRDRADRAKGGRPPHDAVLMFKVLVLQTLYTLSDDQTEYQIRDRLSFIRFLDLALEDRVSDAKTIWLFREQLTRAPAVEMPRCAMRAIWRWAGRSWTPPSSRRGDPG